MLRPLVLDNEEFEDIFEEARSVATSYYPQWTDYNRHDPGITLLELFSLRKEEQQYYLDQIGDAHFAAYLKLLGIFRKPLTPATCLVHLEPARDLSVINGTKFYADNLVFEIDETKQLVKDDVDVCLISDGKEGVRKLRQEWQFHQTTSGFMPFGEKPKCGTHFYMKSASALPAKRDLSLYIAVAGEEGIRRNPVAGREDEAEIRFVPLVKLSLSYYSDGRWRPVADGFDGTRGLLEDGFFTFSLPDEMEPTTVSGEDGYFLRMTFEDGLFDITPRIRRVSLNICAAVQRDTKIEAVFVRGDGEAVVLSTAMSDYGINRLFRQEGERFVPVSVAKKEYIDEIDAIRLRIKDGVSDGEAVRYLAVNMEWEEYSLHTLGVANGFPGQEIEMKSTGILPKHLRLLIEDELMPHTFRLWEWVEDFGLCGPEDRVFTFDEGANVIRFGDGIRGMSPEGEILLVGLSLTEGAQGNIKIGRINRIAGIGVDDTIISNITDGVGGAPQESFRDCFLRARRMMKSPQTAITARDIEERIKKTPGLMLEAVKVLPVDDVRRFSKHVSELDFHTMVRPYGHKRGMPLHPGYELNIRRYMEEYRPIGSTIILYPPDYVEVELFVDAVARPEYRYLERLLDEDLHSYFEQFSDVFGCVIGYGSLYGWLSNRPYIRHLRSLDMSVKGTGAEQNEEGDILLSPNGIVILGRIRHALSMV